jgi:hypothetical protein
MRTRKALVRASVIVASGSIFPTHVLLSDLPASSALNILLVELGSLITVCLVQLLLQVERHRTALELLRAAQGPVSIVIYSDGGIEMRPQGDESHSGSRTAAH